jgi:hypothetical protein
MIRESMDVVKALVVPAASVNGASFTSVGPVDCHGYELATVRIFLGAIAVQMAALKLQTSDQSGSGFTDLVGSRFGTDANTAGSTSALPTTTDANGLFTITLDLRGKQRYLNIVATAGAGATFLVAFVELSRGANLPQSAANRGLNQELRF